MNGIGYVVGLFGVDTRFVGALPSALMKSHSGSGANGLMIDTMKQYGADSFVGRMSCVAPVSYTHLDVYKRQDLIILASEFIVCSSAQSLISKQSLCD